ncbi:hypothetical protein PHABIO_86 [Pseudomonas phage Phabio]|uniref:Uncharacterized protein n=1 Tax=Pseudomonas phage Phabio TaxID=2006668 RepID=A0A1Y0T1K4_9CAUD|nr:hypothetical protein MZD05_gp086 [Pseudomonas phage Phabio]ARV76717.1 hypothetical protein PHABIO_86 [Pseudomonas phage Phabio]
MNWTFNPLGFFSKQAKSVPTTTFIEDEPEMIEEEHSPDDCVEIPLNHAQLFFDKVFGTASDDAKITLEKWFEHLKKENNLTTQEEVVEYIWEGVGKPDMGEQSDKNFFDSSWQVVHYAVMAVWNWYGEWREEVAKYVVFENIDGSWFVTADHRQFPVQFGDQPKNHDIIPIPFYNFKNGKAIMHMRTNDGVVSMIIGTDYRIKTALDEQGKHIDKFTVKRSGNVCDLLVITTTLTDFLRENKNV